MNAASPDTLAPPLDAASLAEAFQAFARASEDLTQAYSGLQGQVTTLTERLDLLLAALPAGVVVVDQQGRVEQCNGAALQMLGAGVMGGDWQAFAARIFEATDTPGEWALKTHVADVDEERAEERRVSLSSTPQAASGGRIVLLHDVTEAWRMRVSSSRNERLAAMGEMVASLAHQLRTPLAAALLYTGHLATPTLNATERATATERAVERLRHLEKLIQDMLIFARGEALGREQFSACELLAELASTIEPVARRKSVRFESGCEAVGEQLFGNRKEIAGALLNLLENAVQAVGEGELVALAARCDGDQLRFSVRDSGPGIPAAMQPRLFEPFFTTRADGTGLGLAIARGVARAHGGDIVLRSAPGEGSEFSFCLPRMDQSLSEQVTQ